MMFTTAEKRLTDAAAIALLTTPAATDTAVADHAFGGSSPENGSDCAGEALDTGA